MKKIFLCLALLFFATPHLLWGAQAPNTIEVLQKKAKKGETNAQYRLGLHYYGKDIAKNNKTAYQWFKKAAKKGHADAQYNLGAFYANGQGVAKDRVSAYMWWDVLASYRKGDAMASAAKNRDLIALIMTTKAVATAKKRAKICYQSHYKKC